MAFLAAKAMEAEQEAEFKQQEERFNTCLRDLLAAFKFHCVTPALRAYTGDYSLNLNSYLAGANNDAEIKFLRALPPDDPRKEALRFRNPPK